MPRHEKRFFLLRVLANHFEVTKIVKSSIQRSELIRCLLPKPQAHLQLVKEAAQYKRFCEDEERLYNQSRAAIPGAVQGSSRSLDIDVSTSGSVEDALGHSEECFRNP